LKILIKMARDKYHYIVREALERDGWEIKNDPFVARYGDRKIEVDLEAEKLIEAERDSERILVEIKSFLTASAFYEFHGALGQYKNYRRILRLIGIEAVLYLAMPEDVYNLLLSDEFGRLTIEEENLKIILFRPIEKDISRWIK
jgi:glucose-6-phosphate 1-dehydrogenase